MTELSTISSGSTPTHGLEIRLTDLKRAFYNYAHDSNIAYRKKITRQWRKDRRAAGRVWRKKHPRKPFPRAQLIIQTRDVDEMWREFWKTMYVHYGPHPALWNNSSIPLQIYSSDMFFIASQYEKYILAWEEAQATMTVSIPKPPRYTIKKSWWQSFVDSCKRFITGS